MAKKKNTYTIFRSFSSKCIHYFDRNIIIVYLTIFKLQFSACNQNDGWKTFNSHCYKYFGAQKTWSNAKTYCQNLGSYLLTAHSQAERDFALSLYPAGTRVWMGGNDIAANGAWIWEDGKPWGVYTAWISGEPNGGDSESCLEMFKSGSYHGLWNDVSCRTSRTFICKKWSLLQFLLPERFSINQNELL